MCHEFDIFVKSLVYQEVIFSYNAFYKSEAVLRKLIKEDFSK